MDTLQKTQLQTGTDVEVQNLIRTFEEEGYTPSPEVLARLVTIEQRLTLGVNAIRDVEEFATNALKQMGEDTAAERSAQHR